MNSQNSLIRKKILFKNEQKDRLNSQRGLTDVHFQIENKSQGCNVHIGNTVNNILTTLYGNG